MSYARYTNFRVSFKTCTSLQGQNISESFIHSVLRLHTAMVPWRVISASASITRGTDLLSAEKRNGGLVLESEKVRVYFFHK